MRKFTGPIDRWVMLCQVAQVVGGNALASVWDFDTGGDKTFSQGIRCSSDGLEPASHILIETVCDIEMNTGIESAISQGTPWLTGYRVSEGWTQESVLADMGLKEIREA